MSRRGGIQAGLSPGAAAGLGRDVAGVDTLPGSQDPENAHMHGMCAPGMTRQQCQNRFLDYINDQISSCTQQGLARALHAAQDFYAGGHRNFREYGGLLSIGIPHVYQDANPTIEEVDGVTGVTQSLIQRYNEECSSCR